MFQKLSGTNLVDLGSSPLNCKKQNMKQSLCIQRKISDLNLQLEQENNAHASNNLKGNQEDIQFRHLLSVKNNQNVVKTETNTSNNKQHTKKYFQPFLSHNHQIQQVQKQQQIKKQINNNSSQLQIQQSNSQINQQSSRMRSKTNGNQGNNQIFSVQSCKNINAMSFGQLSNNQQKKQQKQQNCLKQEQPNLSNQSNNSSEKNNVFLTVKDKQSIIVNDLFSKQQQINNNQRDKILGVGQQQVQPLQNQQNQQHNVNNKKQNQEINNLNQYQNINYQIPTNTLSTSNSKGNLKKIQLPYQKINFQNIQYLNTENNEEFQLQNIENRQSPRDKYLQLKQNKCFSNTTTNLNGKDAQNQQIQQQYENKKQQILNQNNSNNKSINRGLSPSNSNNLKLLSQKNGVCDLKVDNSGEIVEVDSQEYSHLLKKLKDSERKIQTLQVREQQMLELIENLHKENKIIKSELEMIEEQNEQNEKLKYEILDLQRELTKQEQRVSQIRCEKEQIQALLNKQEKEKEKEIQQSDSKNKVATFGQKNLNNELYKRQSSKENCEIKEGNLAKFQKHYQELQEFFNQQSNDGVCNGIKELIHNHKNNQKFIRSVCDLTIKCSPSDTFKENPNLKQVWSFIKKVMNEYLQIKGKMDEGEKEIIHLTKQYLDVKNNREIIPKIYSLQESNRQFQETFAKLTGSNQNLKDFNQLLNTNFSFSATNSLNFKNQK